MRIESPRSTERFGSVRINEVQKVLQLDSGRPKDLPLQENIAVQKIEEDVLKDSEEKMAIVVPIKDEKLQLFNGVISGIPHECLIIVASNSHRKRVDRLQMERDTVSQFCHFTRRQAMIFHQKDPVIAQALAEAGYNDLLGEDGRVRSGKAEGMVVAVLMAMLAKKQYVGFIDADNYFPGSAWEYARCYASGFSMTKSPYAMVRILWRYKPKVSGGIYFKKWGRVSEITNRCVNSLISSKTGFETEVIKTGNAGEHAMSLKLAEMLSYASGYAVEPNELVSIFEQLGGVLPINNQAAVKHGVDILQIESLNPHLHEEKGGEHLKDMLLTGLGSVYHSPLCGDEAKQTILNELLQQEAIVQGEEPVKPRIIAPPKSIDLKKFLNVVEEHLDSFLVLENNKS